ncbi:MAG: chemotaxis protein methyltransferase CheR [Myxococcota bacterium]|jgi:chemotaxis protein methyltransferase CheR
MGIDANDFSFIAGLVRDRSAIVIEKGKEYLVEARMAPIIRSEKLDGIPELITQLRRAPDSDLVDAVVDAMTTNETSWFRDRHPFDVLKSQVIPELIERNEEKRKFHIWCGAASTGQEPYTIAMIIREHFPILEGWDVKIIATDLSMTVLNQAISGHYGQIEMNRGLPAPLLAKYFVRDGTGWVVSEEIRRLVDFRPLNLIENWPVMPKADLVFLRNVLIYFDVETKRAILEGVRKQMEPHAYLFLGGAETTMNVHNDFERFPMGKTAGYKVRRRA